METLPATMDELSALFGSLSDESKAVIVREIITRAAPRALDVTREKMVMRFMPKDAKTLAKVEKAVKNRVALFRSQKPEVVDVDDEVLSGRNKFGVNPLPRTLNEPERMESKYRILEYTDPKNGRQIAQVVTLTVWADWTCAQAVAWNKGMVSQACGRNEPHAINFSTRMQTDVQTRAVLMWLQLHGLFFWDESIKSFNTSLYFDADKKILRRIRCEDFQAWLQNHADINPELADFKKLMSDIDAIAFNPEVARPCRPKALFNRRKVKGEDFIYISCGDSWMMKIGASADGKNIECVPNGTDDVVFLSGQTLAPWELLDDDGEDPFITVAPFATANYKSRFGADIARMWVLSLPACQAAFPALLCTGKARSGKTRYAKAICEMLGTANRSASIDPGSSGKKDFWTIVNQGGIVNFDNVDTKIDWFGDAMQQACTDGSFESRTLFKDGEITTLKSNSRNILTANNPLFAAEAGLSDRLQIVRLLPFDGSNGKEVADTDITNEILEHRNASLTWMARTISRAMADKEPVEKNVCFRHPDFADFALRCSRSLKVIGDDGEPSSRYESAVLALKSAEFDKALLTVQNVSGSRLIYEALVYYFTKKAGLEGNPQVWDGRSTKMLELILESHPELLNKDDEATKNAPSPSSIGYYLDKYFEQFSVIFDVGTPDKSPGNGVLYTFKGFSAAYKMNEIGTSENSQKNETDENEEYSDIF